MKKLFTLCLAISMASVAFAQVDNLDSIIKQKAAAAPFMGAINSAVEVRYKVKTIMYLHDIGEKNQESVSPAYMVPGTNPKDTNWNLDEVEGEFVLVEGVFDPFGGVLVINQKHKDKDGARYDLVKNYNIRPKGCAMYLIDENWLVGSVECLGSEEQSPLGYPTYALKNILYDVQKKVVEGPLHIEYAGKEVEAKGRFFKGDRMVLVNIAGTATQTKMAQEPKAKMLFFKDNIFGMLAGGEGYNNFKLRTNRFASASVKDRTLKADSYNNGYFELNEGFFDLSGTGGDPLFYEDPLGAQYLVGFNAGRITSNHPSGDDEIIQAEYQGEVVNRYYDFHVSDYKFMQKVISSKSPADWERIKKNLVIK